MKGHASLNRVYKLVWSKEQNTWVPVSEVTSGKGKSSGVRGILRKAARFGASCILGAVSYAAFADSPQGVNVRAGAASVIQNLPNQTQINQSTQKTIIDWSSFSIGADHTVRFVMPNSSSISLNRVVGDQASSIQGALLSNGQVWLLNPNGVFIGQGARVNTQGFLATTRSLANEQFLAGQYNFSNDSASGAAVVNAGQVTSFNGGYAVLAGQTVTNSGLVQATLGRVVLGGAGAYTLDVVGDHLLSFEVARNTDLESIGQQANIQNIGSLKADGGQVLLTAQSVSKVLQGVVNVGGFTQANSVTLDNGIVVLGQVDVRGGDAGQTVVSGVVSTQGLSRGEQGGAINMTGQSVELVSSSQLLADGWAGGGSVHVGAGWKGAKIEQSAISQAVSTAKGSVLSANATLAGSGGEVVVFSDLQDSHGLTTVAGKLTARGVGEGGNGGRIETSGHQVVLNSPDINAGSDVAKAGLWLLDPTNVTIDAAAAETIRQNLINSDVTVSTTSMNSDDGDITVASNILYDGSGDRTLTLQAERDIVFQPNVNISSTTSALNTILWSDSDAQGGGRIYMPSGSGIYSLGGRIVLGGGAGSTEPFGPAEGRAEFTNNVPHGVALFGATLSSSGGDISITGRSANLPTPMPVSDDSGTLETSTARVSGVVIGTDNTGSQPVGSLVDSGNGHVFISGEAISSFGDQGAAVYVQPLSVVRSNSLDNFAIQINGDASQSSSSEAGASRVGILNRGTIDALSGGVSLFGRGGSSDLSAGIMQWGNLLFSQGFSSIEGIAGVSSGAFSAENSADVSFNSGVTGTLEDPLPTPDPSQAPSELGIRADTLFVGGDIRVSGRVGVTASSDLPMFVVGGEDQPTYGAQPAVLGLNAAELGHFNVGELALNTFNTEGQTQPSLYINTAINQAGIRALSMHSTGLVHLNADIQTQEGVNIDASVLVAGNQRTVATQNKDITITGLIDANPMTEIPQTAPTQLTVVSGAGSVHLNSDIGTQSPFGGLTVSAGQGINLYANNISMIDPMTEPSSFIQLNGHVNMLTPLTLQAGAVSIVGSLSAANSMPDLNLNAMDAIISGPVASESLVSVHALGNLSLVNNTGAPSVFGDVSVGGNLVLSETNLAVASDFRIQNLSVQGNAVLTLNAQSESFAPFAFSAMNGLLEVNSNQSVVIHNNVAAYLGNTTVTGAFSLDAQGDITQADNTIVNVGQSLLLDAGGTLNVGRVIAGGDINLNAHQPSGTSQPSMSPSPSPADIVVRDTVESTAGDVKMVAEGNFISNVAPTVAPIAVSAGHHYLVYSTDPSLNVETGLNYDFRQHNVMSVNDSVAGSGSGLLYSSPYLVDASPQQILTKQYDSNNMLTASTLVSLNFDGVYAGDVISASLSSPVVFDGVNAGSQASFTSNQLTLDSVTNQGRPVYGVQLASNSNTVVNAAIIPKILIAILSGPVNKTYDGTSDTLDSSGAISLNGVVNGEQVLVSGVFGAYSSKNAGSAIDVTLNLDNATFTGGGSTLMSNYAVPTGMVSAAQGNIAQRMLNINFVGVNKTYDGTTAAAVSSSDDRIANDQLGVAQNAAFTDKNAGAGKTIAVSNIALNGADAQNYSTAATASTSASIVPKTVAVNLAGTVSKVADGTTTATVQPANYQVTGLVQGDSLLVTQTQGTYASAQPALQIPVSVALSNQDLNNSNYVLVQNGGLITSPIGVITAATNKTETIVTEVNASLKSVTTGSSSQPNPPPQQQPASPDKSSTSSTNTQQPPPKKDAAPDGQSTTQSGTPPAPSSGTNPPPPPPADTSPPQQVSSGNSNVPPPVPVQPAPVNLPPSIVANIPVVVAPPSPVGNVMPPTPVDLADAGDKVLAAVAPAPAVEPAPSEQRQVLGVTTVDMNGVPMQQQVVATLLPNAAQQQRYSLTGNSSTW